MNESNYKSAIWKPGWFELDQSLVVGVRGQFRFFREKPSSLNGEDYDFVFFNQMDDIADSELRFAVVTGICHEVLGPLSRIEADGLDYVFATVDGECIVVNAEEEPGATYDGEFEVDDWSVIVQLDELSEPINDVA